MPYTNLPLAEFSGGLNLRDGADDISYPAALDLLNVTFLPQGAVAQRAGFKCFTATAGTNRYDSLSPFYKADGTKQLVAGAGNRLEAITTAGANIATSTAPTANPHYFVRFAAPGSEHLYISNGTDTIRRWDGASFTTPTFTVGTGCFATGMFLTSTPWDDRLVTARSSAQPSRVCFSDPGVPTTFSNNSYVDLDPGDGEAIMGLTRYGQYVFVFKETKFYVFYSTNTVPDPTSGNPVVTFNYRTVNNRIGLLASRALTTGRDGVYFLDRKGVYQTTGSTPSLVSDVLRPFFDGNPAVFFKSNTLNQAAPSSSTATWVNERLYVSVPTGTSTTNDRTLVYDPRYSWWTLWDIPIAAGTAFHPADRDELIFALASGSKDIARYTDNSGLLRDTVAFDGSGGTAITARWRSGWLDYGWITPRGRLYSSPYVKVIRQSELWGEGTVTLSMTKDWHDVALQSDTTTFSSSAGSWGDGTDATNVWGDGSNTSNPWGPAGTTRPRLIRRALRGTVFSFQFSNVTLDKTFTIHRFIMSLHGQRVPGVIDDDESGNNQA